LTLYVLPGTIKDSDLVDTGWNVTGTRAVLNVGHQFTVGLAAMGQDAKSISNDRKSAA
jgi:hypothetical protein